MAATTVSLRELADLAIGTPELGAVNFTALHTLIVAILKNLNLHEARIDYKSPAPVYDEALYHKPAQVSVSVPQVITTKEKRKSISKTSSQVLESQVKDLDRQVRSMESQLQGIVSHVQLFTSHKGDFDSDTQDSIDEPTVATRGPERSVATLTPDKKLMTTSGPQKKFTGVPEKRPTTTMMEKMQRGQLRIVQDDKDSEVTVTEALGLLQHVLQDVYVLKEAHGKAQELSEMKPQTVLEKRMDTLEKHIKERDNLLDLVGRKLSLIPGGEEATMVTWEELEQAITDGWKSSQAMSDTSISAPKRKGQNLSTSVDVNQSGISTKQLSTDSVGGVALAKTFSGSSDSAYPSERDRDRAPSMADFSVREQLSSARDEVGLLKPHHPSIPQLKVDPDRRRSREQYSLSHQRRDEQVPQPDLVQQDSTLSRDQLDLGSSDQQGMMYLSPDLGQTQRGLGPPGRDQIRLVYPSTYPQGMVPPSMGQQGVAPRGMAQQAFIPVGMAQYGTVPPLVPGRDQQGLEAPTTDERNMVLPGIDQHGSEQFGMDQYGFVPFGMDQYGLVTPFVYQSGLVPPGLMQATADQQTFMQPGLEVPGFVHPGAEQHDLAQPGAVQPGMVQPGAVQSGVVQRGAVQPGMVQPGAVQRGVVQRGAVQPGAVQRGVVQPGAVQRGMVQRSPVQPGAVQPGMVQPGAVQPGMVQPGAVQPGMVQPGAVQSGMVQPGAVQSGMVQPGAVQPDMVQPGMVQRGAVQRGVVQRGAVQPGAVQPGAVQPGAVQPGAVQPGAVQPGAVQHGVVQPGAVHHGVVQPGAVQPGAVQRGVVQPGAVQHGAVQPGAVQPDTVQPGMVQPGAVQPGAVQPGTDQHDLVQPGEDQPSLVHPVVGDQPSLVHPVVGDQPGLVHSVVGDQPGAVQPGLVQMGAYPRGWMQPGIYPPGLVQPGTYPLVLVPPDVDQHGLVQPGTYPPSLGQLGAEQHGVLQPAVYPPIWGQPSAYALTSEQPSAYALTSEQPSAYALTSEQPSAHALTSEQPGPDQQGLMQPTADQHHFIQLDTDQQSGVDQHGLVQPGAYPPSLVPTGTDQYGLVQHGAGQHDLAQPGVGQLDVVQPGMDQHGLMQLSADQHDLVQPEEDQRDSVPPGADKRDSVPPGADQRGIVQPGADQRGMVQPGAHQRGIVQPGAHQRGLVPPGADQRGIVQPGAHQRGMVQPGFYPPSSMPLGTYPPGSMQPRAHLPGAYPPGSVPAGAYRPGLVQYGTYPPGSVQAGIYPPGSIQAGTYPPGSVQAGTYPPGSIQAGTYPPGSVQAGTYPPGSIQAGAYPPGSVQAGAYPPGSVQAGAYPPGSVQAGTYPPGSIQAGTYPPGSVQAGAYPPGSVQLGAYPRGFLEPITDEHGLGAPRGPDQQDLLPPLTERHDFLPSQVDALRLMLSRPYQQGVAPPDRAQDDQVPSLPAHPTLTQPGIDQGDLVPQPDQPPSVLPGPDQSGPAYPGYRPGLQGADQHSQVDLYPSQPRIPAQTDSVRNISRTQFPGILYSLENAEDYSERRDSLDKLTPSFPMAVETFRLMGEIVGLYVELKEHINDLDEEQAGQTDLEKIQYMIALMVKKSIPPDLQEQMKSVKTLAKEVRQEKAKLDRMQKILEGEGARETGKEIKTGQLGLQLGILRVTVSDIEKELAELRESQEQGKISMEHSVSEASLYLQDQLDKLRTIIESMLTSSSTLLSMSMVPHKAPVALTPGQIDPEATCPACSLDVSHQVSTLVQRYERLQDMVNNLAASRPSKKAKLQSQDEELLGQVQSAILQVQGDCEKLNITTSNLIEDHRQKQKDIKVLYQGLEKLEKEKANREHLEMEIDVKADKSALAGKVSRAQFDATTEQLNHMMQELVAKMSGQEQDWQKMLDRLLVEMDSKLDRLELDPVKQLLEDRWKSLRQQLKERSPLYQADEAAAMRRQLLAHFHCLSCDRPLETPVTGQSIPVTPVGLGLPGHRSTRPYTIFELEQVRQQSRNLKLGSAFPRGDLGLMERSVGRLHTMHSKMLMDIEKVQIHFGGSVKASSQMIRELLQAQCLSSPCYKRVPDLADYTYSSMPRRCGGSHTLTYPYRRNRLQHLAQALLPTEEIQIAMKHDEVDILGLDGHIYKGRMDTRLPGILTKDTPGVAKPKSKQPRAHVHRQQSVVNHGQLPSRPQSAQTMAGNTSAPSRQRKGRPVSSEGRFSQSNLVHPLSPTETESANRPAGSSLGLEMPMNIPPQEGAEEPTRGPRSTTAH